MKMNPAMNFSLLVILSLAAAFLSGCITTPPVDWDSRVGHYTYSQAVAELGPPSRSARLSDGKIEYKWFIHPYGSTSYNAGLSPYNINNNLGPSPVIGPSFDNRILKLTFDTNGTLTAWSKNY